MSEGQRALLVASGSALAALVIFVSGAGVLTVVSPHWPQAATLALFALVVAAGLSPLAVAVWRSAGQHKKDA